MKYKESNCNRVLSAFLTAGGDILPEHFVTTRLDAIPTVTCYVPAEHTQNLQVHIQFAGDACTGTFDLLLDGVYRNHHNFGDFAESWKVWDEKVIWHSAIGKAKGNLVRGPLLLQPGGEATRPPAQNTTKHPVPPASVISITVSLRKGPSERNFYDHKYRVPEDTPMQSANLPLLDPNSAGWFRTSMDTRSTKGMRPGHRPSVRFDFLVRDAAYIEKKLAENAVKPQRRRSSTITTANMNSAEHRVESKQLPDRKRSVGTPPPKSAAISRQSTAPPHAARVFLTASPSPLFVPMENGKITPEAVQSLDTMIRTQQDAQTPSKADCPPLTPVKPTPDSLRKSQTAPAWLRPEKRERSPTDVEPLLKLRTEKRLRRERDDAEIERLRKELAETERRAKEYEDRSRKVIEMLDERHEKAEQQKDDLRKMLDYSRNAIKTWEAEDGLDE